METAADPQLVLSRFTRLMNELQRGQITRNTFEPWEVELLLDIGACGLKPKRLRSVLRGYRKAAERRLDYGVVPPLKLSEYLKQNLRASG